MGNGRGVDALGLNRVLGEVIANNGLWSGEYGIPTGFVREITGNERLSDAFAG